MQYMLSVSLFFASRTTHYASLLRLLRYTGCIDTRLLFILATSSLDLRAYSDVDWAGDVTELRSATGLCVFVW